MGPLPKYEKSSIDAGILKRTPTLGSSGTSAETPSKNKEVCISPLGETIYSNWRVCPVERIYCDVITTIEPFSSALTTAVSIFHGSLEAFFHKERRLLSPLP